MTSPTPFRCRTWGGPGASGPRSVVVLIMFLLFFLMPLAPPAQAHEGEGDVMVIPVHGTIEPGMGEFLDRAISEAEGAGIATIVLDIDTPGGRLETVLDMRTRILDSGIPIVAYINRQALSAGALIPIASDQIWMAPGAVFGAAMRGDGASGGTANAEGISALRSAFRATAEARGRDPVLAEAMVDPAIVVEGIDDAGTLLTLRANEAQDYGYANGVAVDRYVLLDELKFGHATVIDEEMSFGERLVNWVTDPVVGTLLVLVGVELIVADGIARGAGIAAVAGLATLGLFFWGYLVTGLAGREELLLTGIGVILIAFEVFAKPRFAIAGIGGIVALVSGLVLTMTTGDIGEEGFAREARDVLTTVSFTLAAGILLSIAILFLMAWLVPSWAARTRWSIGAGGARIAPAGPMVTPGMEMASSEMGTPVSPSAPARRGRARRRPVRTDGQRIRRPSARRGQ